MTARIYRHSEKLFRGSEGTDDPDKVSQSATSDERCGSMTPAEIARLLRLSEGAVSSVLSMLAQEGKLRIARVELPSRDDGRQLSL